MTVPRRPTIHSVLLVLAITAPAAFLTAVPAVGGAFPTGWAHVRPILVENPGGSLADHQLLVVFDSASLIAAAKLQGTCADVRFTDGDAAVLLPNWIESGCGEAATRAWVRVPTVPAGASRIHLHYGNPTAASAADAAATFLLYDGFSGAALDASTWRVVENDGGAISVAAGALTVSRAVNTGITDLRSVASFSGSVVLEYRQRLAPSDSHHYWSSAYFGATGQYSSIGYVSIEPYESAIATSSNRWPARSSSSGSDNGDVIATPPMGQWFVERFAIPAGGAIRRSLDGATDDVSSRYAGVSSGEVGLLTGAPGWGKTQVTETDWIRLRRLAATDPSVTVGAEATPPTPPRAVSAAPGVDVGEVALSWTEPESDGGMRVRAYHVYRAAAPGGPFDHIASLGADARALTDDGRTPLVTQYYAVAASNFVGEGAPSAETCSKPFPWTSVDGDNLCSLPIAGTESMP